MTVLSIWAMRSITVSIMVPMSLLEESNISMVLNLFGVILRGVWLNFMVFPKRCFICISKKRSLGLTTGMKI
ncbi:putative transposase [Neisseria meningitidis NM3164]|nr:putative transposase [Neisseria meningitidis NM271]EOC58996.1 putative transposase [Neisseria meningitidis NM90]EOC66747.1 putative transposase [Neisseria meningitidis NM3222]EOC67772.1 putative d-alanyl-D-alanine carboxypeptidase/endopeptidase [Neisseria meningitidis NM3042]EOC68627.1 putative d-alanyl-D-alanine carboxypeptidase/endopeptidase [Neisseria meningitidis NM3158]EOC69379.1 putative transposase [Neisseria meningitidis NM3144]EOC69390.1 putative transposase [Neisseria meningitidi